MTHIKLILCQDYQSGGDFETVIFSNVLSIQKSKLNCLIILTGYHPTVIRIPDSEHVTMTNVLTNKMLIFLIIFLIYMNV